jgi:PBP1b-binding outer membrane lipoprotein LpoB
MKVVRIAGMLLALGVVVTGCTENHQPAAETTPTAAQPSSTTSPSGTPSTQKISPRVTPGETGGLTIRYLDKDGTIKTVRIEDFSH